MNSNKGSFVFVESNTTGTGQLICEKVIERGFRTFFITSNKQKYHYLSELDIITLHADTSSTEAILEAIKGIVDIKAVFSTSEYFVGKASAVADKLGLSTYNTEAIELCRSKFDLFERLDSKGIATPYTSAWNSASQDPHLAMRSHSFPVVMKPNTGSGSCGVKLLESVESAGLAIELAVNEPAQTILFQQYIEGQEFSVEAVTVEGNTEVFAIVRKEVSAPPTFVETVHTFPSELEESLRKDIELQVIKSLQAVGFRFGFSHTEVKYSGGKVYIIEINPRLAGGMIPFMLGTVFDTDILEHVIDLWLTSSWKVKFKAKKYGQINFLLAPQEGVLVEPVAIPKDLIEDNRIVALHNNYEINQGIKLNGDFKDRLAVIITAASELTSLKTFSKKVIEEATFVIKPTKEQNDSDIQGRVGKLIKPELQKIIYGEQKSSVNIETSIERIFSINDAHLLMLTRTGLIDENKAYQILNLQQKERGAGYKGILATSKCRGLYMAIEDYISSELGVNVGGLLQTARSRNDINATLVKLQLRTAISNVFLELKSLRSILIYRASELRRVAFPVYSQYQPAQPGTFSAHLLAIESALARESHYLLEQLKDLGECPLGACAGGGTTLEIDSELTAKLLGFNSAVQNSLDAVAGRDNVMRFVNSTNQIGTILSRFAQDLQQWTTFESNLAYLPDDLVGGSSLLPQKRNPYLIEYVKSCSTQLFGEYSGVSMLLAKTPYTNSYEVSSMIEKHISKAETFAVNGMSVFSSLVSSISINKERVERLCLEAGINSTMIANTLQQREKISFREAHERVGRAISVACDNNESIHLALSRECPDIEQEPAIKMSALHKFGGGAGSASTPSQILQHSHSLIEHSLILKQYKSYWQRCESLKASFIKALNFK